MDACQKVGDSAIATLDFAVLFSRQKALSPVNNSIFFTIAKRNIKESYNLKKMLLRMYWIVIHINQFHTSYYYFLLNGLVNVNVVSQHCSLKFQLYM